jgi:hypothetical protein
VASCGAWPATFGWRSCPRARRRVRLRRLVLSGHAHFRAMDRDVAGGLREWMRPGAGEWLGVVASGEDSRFLGTGRQRACHELQNFQGDGLVCELVWGM